MLDFQKKKQLRILVQIARVDEDFAESEQELIRKIGEKYGADAKELDEIFNSPSISESLAPMAVTDKMNFMMDCILVILADEVVTSSERYFAQQMAEHLGFQKEVVPFLISHKETPRENMYDQMLPYLTNN